MRGRGDGDRHGRRVVRGTGMMVMVSNQCRAEFHYMAGRYPERLGHLYAPDGFRGPFPWFPYALDNGAWGAFKNNRAWSAEEFEALCDKAHVAKQHPLWVAVPDVVADKDATLASWHQWAPKLRRYGWPLAFCAQDGMTGGDVPADADVVFVGGTTAWKRRVVPHFCARFKRVHVGRVNTGRWLWFCVEAGAESIDGTGWYHDDPNQLPALRRFLAEYTDGKRERSHGPLFEEEAA